MQCDFPGCRGSHEPNAETEKVFKDTDAGLNLESHESHDSLKDFWQAMGMKCMPDPGLGCAIEGKNTEELS